MSAGADTHKVLLLDGHSLAFRAFFALPDTLVTSSGQVTNAVYGFTAMLIKLLADERPQGVVVCFDKGVPQFRVDRYADYKAGRAETPDLFRQQLPLIREVLGCLRIPMIDAEGYEAVLTSTAPIGFELPPEDAHLVPEVIPVDGSFDLELCADTLAEFLFRFWIENELWWAIQDGGELPQHLVTYAQLLSRVGADPF